MSLFVLSSSDLSLESVHFSALCSFTGYETARGLPLAQQGIALRRQMYCFCGSALLKVDGGKTMHCEISTLRRTASSLAIGLALLLSMGMTAHAQHDKKGKSEQKLEKSEVKTHEREERVGLKNHQREERETERESRRSKHKAGRQCVKGCKEAHKTAIRACRGKTGADRRACERAANQARRSCQASCPR